MRSRITLFVALLLFFNGCSKKVENILYKHSSQNYQNSICTKSIAYYYWDLKHKNYKDMYAKELPSFRYFYDFDLYKGYYSGFKKFDFIDIINIKKIDDNLYETTLKFYKKTHPLFTIKEKWVKMDGNCYHYLYDPFIFNK